MPHVLMLVMSDIVRDARVRREAEALASAGYDVTVVGDKRPPAPAGTLAYRMVWARQGAQGHQRGRPPRALRWLLLPEHRQREQRAFQKQGFQVASDAGPADVVHAHDLSALPPARELADRWGAKLVYDSHECWIGRRLEGRPAPLSRWWDGRKERRHGAQAELVITVSPGIARFLQSRYGWDHVVVVRNSFPRQRPTAERAPRPQGLLYAGRIDTKRDLDTMADAAAHLDGFRMTAIGPSDDPVLAERLAQHLDIQAPVDIRELDAWFLDHGLGLVPLTADSLNHRLALPNKLFQAVQVGVPVVAADLPEMARVVREHEIGTLYRPGDAGSLEAAVRQAIAAYDELKANVDAAAPELSWERDQEVLLDAYRRLCEDS